jgi:hypothetical protein
MPDRAPRPHVQREYDDTLAKQVRLRRSVLIVSAVSAAWLLTASVVAFFGSWSAVSIPRLVAESMFAALLPILWARLELARVSWRSNSRRLVTLERRLGRREFRFEDVAQPPSIASGVFSRFVVVVLLLTFAVFDISQQLARIVIPTLADRWVFLFASTVAVLLPVGVTGVLCVAIVAINTDETRGESAHRVPPDRNTPT